MPRSASIAAKAHSSWAMRPKPPSTSTRRPLRAAAAMDTQAKKVAKEDVKRTLWVGGIPYEWTHLPYNASDTLPHEDGTTDK